jgi:hypothetical protein
MSDFSVCIKQGSAFLAHFGSFGFFFYGMALFIVGGDFFVTLLY